MEKEVLKRKLALLEEQKKKLAMSLEEQKRKLALNLTKEHARQSASNFKREVDKAMLTAIVAAFSFLIALEWKDVITSYVNQLTSLSYLHGTLVKAFIVTIIGVVGILISTRFLGEKKNINFSQSI